MRFRSNSSGKASSMFFIHSSFNLERGANESIEEEEEIDGEAVMFIIPILIVCSNAFKLHLYSDKCSRYGNRGM